MRVYTVSRILGISSVISMSIPEHIILYCFMAILVTLISSKNSSSVNKRETVGGGNTSRRQKKINAKKELSMSSSQLKYRDYSIMEIKELDSSNNSKWLRNAVVHLCRGQ